MVESADFAAYFEVARNLLNAVRALGAPPAAHTAKAIELAHWLLDEIVSQQLAFKENFDDIDYDAKTEKVRALIAACVARLKMEPRYANDAEWTILTHFGAADATQAVQIWGEC